MFKQETEGRIPLLRGVAPLVAIAATQRRPIYVY